MTISLGLTVVLAVMHLSIHISVTTSLPPNPGGAFSRGTVYGMTVNCRLDTLVGFVNSNPAFFVITSERTSVYLVMRSQKFILPS